MSHELHPLALEFVNTQINVKIIEPGAFPYEKKPIGAVLLYLSTITFGYIDVMQDYIALMKKGIDMLKRFDELVVNICHLARIYMESDKYQKEQVLACLDHDNVSVPIQINNSVPIQINDSEILFRNPIFYTINDSPEHVRPFFIQLLEKIKGTVEKYTHRDTLLYICRHLREQVVPILKVLTELNQKQGGDDFIQHLDLNALIEKLKQIKVKADLMDITRSMLKSSIMPQVRSLLDAAAQKEAQEEREDKVKEARKKFEDSLKAGYAGQSVIGKESFKVKGGRRTRYKRSGHKRSGKRSAHKKRSGHKRSGKRSAHKRSVHKRSVHKRSVHKSRRR
jgi:hypothetical protein